MSDDTEALQTALRAMGRIPVEQPFATDGVNLVLVPREEGLQEKRVPVDALFKKIVSMRDKLRVLEQRVNASDISVDDKIHLQGRITAVYDAIVTLTAFFSDDALPAPAPQEARGEAAAEGEA